VDGWRQALLRPRVLVYGSALLVLATAMAWGWAQRPELRLNAMHDRGVLARMVDDGAVENIYRLQVMNASLQPRQLRLQALAGQGAGQISLPVKHRGTLQVDAAGVSTVVVTVRMPGDEVLRHARGAPLPICFVLDDESAGGAASVQTVSTFLPG